MSFSSALILMLLQVGPNPSAGAIQGAPDELLNRPPRTTNEIAPPQPTDPLSIWLADCLDLVESAPSRAHTKAQIERNQTTGDARVIANHCLGLAATKLSLWDDAIAAFTAARDETPADESRARARFGAMAGNAALAAGDPAQAITFLVRAEINARTANAGGLEAIAAIDRSRALVALDQPDGALAALDNATRLMPDDAEAWLLKATLLRRENRLPEAQTAIEKASGLAPLDPQIGLEAGVIAVLDARDDAARASWQSVIDTAPDSPQAKTASGYLKQLGPATPAQ